METDDVLYERRGHAAWITLNRPKVHNALRERTFDQLFEAASRAALERGLAAVVLTGAGERAFCAGGDILEMRDLDPARGRVFLEKFVRALQALRALPVPVVARIRGYCIAGGNELNLACDLAVASDDSQFGHAGPRVGSVPLILGTQMMPRLTGLEVCRRLRESPATAAIPVILLTAKAQEADVERGFAAGADDYIRKPFSNRELLTRVEALLGRSADA